MRHEVLWRTNLLRRHVLIDFNRSITLPNPISADRRNYTRGDLPLRQKVNFGVGTSPLRGVNSVLAIGSGQPDLFATLHALSLQPVKLACPLVNTSLRRFAKSSNITFSTAPITLVFH